MTSFDLFAPAPVVTAFSGGNFEELFHSEYSEFVTSDPIIDIIAPNCPTNLMCHINTQRKEFLLTWAYPLSTMTPDGSIQNDIKEFDILFYDRQLKQFSIIGKTVIPRFIYKVPDEFTTTAFDFGLSFAIRARDYHDLTSPTSKIINARLNKDYGCKKQEIPPVFISAECGVVEERTRVMYKKMIIEKDIINFSPGTFVSIKEPYVNKTNTLYVTIYDLNSTKKFFLELDVTHNQALHLSPLFTPTAIIASDVGDSIRAGSTMPPPRI